MKIIDIIDEIDGIVINGENIDKNFNNVIIDSRCLNKNDLFIALKGNNYDPHNYIEEIIEKKPAAIIVEKNITIKTKIPIIKVENTYKCLMDIGSKFRKAFLGDVIAVTGSAGKTTTKELISLILSKKYNVLKSIGNKNNHVGVPLTLTQLNNDYDIGVLELGMNHKNEISKLSKVCNPSIGIITNIGTAHIGNLGSKKNIYKAKMEIIDGMDSGILIVNGDDKYLGKLKSSKLNIIKCGIKKGDIRVTRINYGLFKSIFYVINNNKEYKFTLNIPGAHLVKNCLLAIKIGDMYNVPFEDMVDAIASYKTLENRLDVKIYKDNILVDDCYNSNYESVKALIEYIKNINKNKILILGDILELGKYSKRIHKKIGKLLRKNKLENIIFTGEYMYYAHKKNKNSVYLKTTEKVIKYLENIDIHNSLILIKASRGEHLEDISEYLNNRLKNY